MLSAFSSSMRRPLAAAAQRRFLNLHEYQAMNIFQDFGVKTPKNHVVHNLKDFDATVSKFEGDVVIKSMVLAGGRGLGSFKENGFQGGVHVCNSKEQAKEFAGKMLGNTLQTKQNPAGLPVNSVLLCEKFEIESEKYFAILMDRSSGGPVLVGSSQGGTSIEDIAEKYPDAIIKMPIDIIEGMAQEQATEMATKMGFKGEQAKSAAESIMALYRMFTDCDCTLVEINPFCELKDGRVVVCDAKVNFDDNAEFRQAEIHAQRDYSQEDSREVQAKKFDLNYIGLSGSVGCMVNGAGLAMATMDLLKLSDADAANFLDVGGAAQKEQVKAAFEILQDDKNVKAILVNIFGGIMRCDVIAAGMVEACRELGLKKRVVVRLVGTNVKEGMEIINNCGLEAVEVECDLSKAAELVSSYAK